MVRQRIAHRYVLGFLMVQISLAAALSHAADPANELLLRVPASANAVAVVDVEGLFKSKLGTSEGWSRRYVTDYANGMVPFPPSVQTAVLAAKIDTDSIHADWELGLVRLKSPFAMKKLAEKESATLEKFEGHSFVATDRRTSFIELKPQRLAVTNHQNRQDVARWLRATRDASKPMFSDYLLEAVTDPKGQYHLALDLQDVLQFAKKQEVYVYPQNYYSNGWYGGVSYGAGYAFAQTRYEYKNNFAEIEAKQAKVIADAEKDRQQVWDLLQGETAAMRSQLSRKFNTDL